VKTVRCLSILASICVFSAVAFGQSINTDYDRSANFSNYKTYAWGASPHPVNDPLWNQRTMDTIDGALAGKGLQKVNLDQNPDLIVVYNAGVKQNVSYEGYSMGGLVEPHSQHPAGGREGGHPGGRLCGSAYQDDRVARRCGGDAFGQVRQEHPEAPEDGFEDVR